MGARNVYSQYIMKKAESKSEKKDSVFWKAPEFRHRERGAVWHLWAVFIGLALMVVSLWQKNFLFSAFIAIAWFVVIFWSNKKPAIWEFKIDEDGVYVILPGKDFKKFYSYKEMIGFDIHPSEEKSRELVFRMDARLSPYLKIIFPADKEKEIEAFLADFLPREEYEKSASDSFLDLIGF